MRRKKMGWGGNSNQFTLKSKHTFYPIFVLFSKRGTYKKVREVGQKSETVIIKTVYVNQINSYYGAQYSRAQ